MPTFIETARNKELDTLLNHWHQKASQDRIRLPTDVRIDKQLLPDGTIRLFPEEPGIPTTASYGALATIKSRELAPDPTGLRGLFARVLLNLYGTEMQITERISEGELATIVGCPADI
jgi:hypothetical protein